MDAMVAPRLDVAPVTYEEWLAWPETSLPVEVVDGWPIMSPSPAGRHQRISFRLGQVLDAAARPHLEVLAGPYDWVLRREPLLVRQPDLVVVEAATEPPPRLYEPPLVAVEILRPASRERDLVHQRNEYAAAGLAWYWLVDADVPQVVVLRNAGGRFEIHASAVGTEFLDVADPVAVRLRPADLR